MRSMSRVHERFPEIVLLLAIIVLFHRLLLGEVLFWGTPGLQFYPWREFAFSELRRGHLPLWNPFVGNGAPLLANYQTAVFYPPNWLNLILPTAHLMGWLAMLHLVWAGLGMMAYLRRLGLDRFGQGVGALAYALSGYLVSRFGFLTITAAAPWLPWLLWALDGFWDAQGTTLRRRTTLLGAIIALQLLAGHAQTTFYSLVLAGAYALWRAIQHRTYRTLLAALGGFALGVGLAAIQLLPTLELLMNSQRDSGFDRALAFTYSYWPWRALTWFAPNAFGSPATHDYWGFGAYWEDATFVGLLTLFLAGHALFKWVRAPREAAPGRDIVPFFALIVPLAILLALGQNTSIFPWLFDHVPTFDLFQAPARWMLLVVFATVVLASIGAHQWSVSDRTLFAMRLAMAGGVSAIVAAWLGERYVGAVEPTLIRATLRFGISIIVLGPLFLLQPEPGVVRRRLWEGATLVVLSIDLVAAGWGLNPTIDPAFYQARSPLSATLAADLGDARTLYLPQDEYAAKFETFLDTASFGPATLEHWEPLRQALLPNLGALDSIPSANNFDPLRVAPHDALIESTRDTPLPDALPRLRAMNVGALIAIRPPGDLDPIATAGPVTAYAIPDPLPRAYLVHTVQYATSTRDALHLMQTGAFKPDHVVVLESPSASILASPPMTSAEEGTDLARPGNALRSQDNSTARILRDEPTITTIELQATAEGWIVLTDTWYPGWRATLDGNPVTILRANAAFRAVQVPPGRHTVAFTYRPRSLTWGAVVSGLSIIMLILLGRWKHRDAEST